MTAPGSPLHQTERQDDERSRDPTATYAVTSRDGTKLHAAFYGTHNPRSLAVIVHGYSEHGGRYRELANHLRDHGIASLAVDLRGHGRSHGQRGYVRRFTDFLDDVDAAIASSADHIDGAIDIALIGHSNGALAVLRALADPWRCPRRVKAAVLSSPFLELKLAVPPAKKLTGRLASLALPTLTLPNELVVQNLTSDREKQRERRLDTLCHDVASARWFTEAEYTQRWVREFAPRISLPTLWLVSGADQVTHPRAARSLHESLKAPSVYHEFPDSQHEVYNEIRRQAAYELTSDFLLSTLDSQ